LETRPQSRLGKDQKIPDREHSNRKKPDALPLLDYRRWALSQDTTNITGAKSTTMTGGLTGGGRKTKNGESSVGGAGRRKRGLFKGVVNYTTRKQQRKKKGGQIESALGARGLITLRTPAWAQENPRNYIEKSGSHVFLPTGRSRVC